MAQAAVDDLSEPVADQEIELLYWWPAQLGDLYQFTANGDHYDEDQKLAVVGIQHEFRNGEGITRLQTRGSVAGAYRNWLRIAGGTSPGSGGASDLFSSVSQTPNYATNEVTLSWVWDGDPSATFNLYVEENTGTTPVDYLLYGGSPFAAGTSSVVYSTAADIDAGGTSQANIGFYVRALLGTTVVAESVKSLEIYNANSE